MIQVTKDWWWGFVFAGGAGLVGGIVYELVLARLGDSGLLELPSKQDGPPASKRKYLDMGFLASLLVGAVAGSAFLYFMPPEIRSEVVRVAGQADVTTTIREYDPFKLITAALIVGTGGASFITAMRDRLLKSVNQTNLRTLSQSIVAQADQIGTNIDHARKTGTEPISHDEVAGRMSALATVARVAASNSKP